MSRTISLAVALLAVLLVACAAEAEPDTPTSPPVLVGGPEAALGEDEQPEVALEAGQEPQRPELVREPQLVSLGWLGSGATISGLDGDIAAPHADQALRAAVDDALASFDGRAAVVVHNLADGRYAAWNESEVFYAASTFKAAVLLEAYRQRDRGDLDFAKQVTLEKKYTENDLGTLEYLELKEGDHVTIADAVKGMIVVSDTSLATLVMEQVTGNRVDETLREIGAEKMMVNSHDLPTTALDLTQLLIAIASGYGVTPESRDEMLSYMAQEWFRDGIAAGVPEGTQFAHKSGSFANATHDAAIVWGAAGPYVITVLTDGSAGWEPVAAVSEAVWGYFEGGAVGAAD